MVQPAIRLFAEKKIKERRKGKKGRRVLFIFLFPFLLVLRLSRHAKSLLSRNLLRSDYWVRPIWLFCQKECSSFYAVYSSPSGLNGSIFHDVFSSSISKFFQQISYFLCRSYLTAPSKFPAGCLNRVRHKCI